jgi:hypothetical protein
MKIIPYDYMNMLFAAAGLMPGLIEVYVFSNQVQEKL